MTGFTARGYLDYIRTPGRGWGSGCRVERIAAKTIDGVEFVRGTAVDNRTGERGAVYVTDDGFTVTPVTGGYARWSVSAQHDGISRWQSDHGRVGTGVEFVSNLTRAAAIITEARDWTTFVGATLTPRNLP